MKKTTLLTVMACGLLSTSACATFPSFERLGAAADAAFSDAMEMVDECRAISDNESDVAECVDGVIKALRSSSDVGLDVAAAVCDEVEARGDLKCAPLGNEESGE